MIWDDHIRRDKGKSYCLVHPVCANGRKLNFGDIGTRRHPDYDVKFGRDRKLPVMIQTSDRPVNEAQTPTVWRELDQWLRHRLRAIQLKR